ncbi:MAG: GspE/PulE family protein [Phycisphaerales bacterium]
MPIAFEPNIPSILAATADAAFLASFIKPVLLLASFLPFAWVISSRLEPDARINRMNVAAWNAAFVGTAIAALAAALLIPIFWVGWPIAVLLLVGVLFAYWKIRDAKVPEDRRFKLFSGEMQAKLEARRARRGIAAAQIAFTGPDGVARNVPEKDDELFPIHMRVEDLLVPALERRASRVEILPGRNGIVASALVDGVRVALAKLSPEETPPILDYIKRQADLDVEDRRRLQEAEFRLRGPTGDAAVTLTTSGSSAGQTLRLEFDRRTRLGRSYDTLGLHQNQKAVLAPLTEPEHRHGVVLVTAPAGQGLTTTGYALLGRHDAFTCNIKTLEEKVEFDLEGVDHVGWTTSDPTTPFATTLQSMLRRDPDIMLVGATNEPRVLSTAAGPGPDGPLLYVLMQQPGVAAAITEWCRSVGDLKAASRGLRAVTTQRLMRTLCPNCKQPAQTTPDQLRKLGIPERAAGQIQRAVGKIQPARNRIEDCPVCQGSGYLGQVAVFEVMPVDDDVRAQLLAGDLKAAVAEARRKKMLLLPEAALAKVVAGETSLEEFARVFAPKSAARPSAPRGSAAKS